MKRKSEDSKLGPKALRLKDVKIFYKLKTEKEFADYLGIPPTTLSSWYTRSSPDMDIIYAKCGDINLDWLITGEGEMLRSSMRVTDDHNSYTASSQQTKIPLIPIESFGGLGDRKLDIPDNAWYVIPAFNGADFLTTVNDNSMYPNYIAGDIIACKKLQPENILFKWDKVYVLETKQGVQLRRVKETKKDSTILLVNDNPDYKPAELLRSKISAIAIVIGVLRSA